MAIELERLSRAELAELVALGRGLPEAETDEMAIPSYSHGNPLIRWLMWRRYQVIAELAATRPVGDAFELGCGVGLFLPTLCRLAQRVSATDLQPLFARALIARRRLPVTWRESVDAIEPASLDLIVAADVLEHIDDLEDCAARLAAALRPGGRLLVSGPTENWLYRLGRQAAGFAGKGDYHVRSMYGVVETLLGQPLRQRRQARLPFAWGPPLFLIVELEKI